jgi:DNA-binding ferritin-like protein
MAIHAYDQCLRQVEVHNIKEVFQKNQDDHRSNAAQISEKIRSLGGNPVNGHGLMSEIMLEMKAVRDKEEISVLKDAVTQEEQSIEKLSEMLRGDLDNQTMSLIKDIINQDKEHLSALLDEVEYQIKHNH